MGLLIVTARFCARPPPSEEVFRAEFIRHLGSGAGLEGFTVGGENAVSVVEVTTAQNPLCCQYARKVLRDLGGEIQGRPAPPTWFVAKPWKEWPWWRRAGFRVLGAMGVILFVPTVLVLELVRAARRFRAR